MSEDFAMQMQYAEANNICVMLADILPTLEKYDSDITMTEIVERFFRMLDLFTKKGSLLPLLIMGSYRQVQPGHLPEILAQTLEEEELVNTWLVLGDHLLHSTAAGTRQEQLERIPLLEKLQESCSSFARMCETRLKLLNQQFGRLIDAPAAGPTHKFLPLESPMSTLNKDLSKHLPTPEPAQKQQKPKMQPSSLSNSLKSLNNSFSPYNVELNSSGCSSPLPSEDFSDKASVNNSENDIPMSDEDNELIPDVNDPLYVKKPGQLDDVTVGDGTWGRIQARNLNAIKKRQEQKERIQEKERGESSRFNQGKTSNKSPGIVTSDNNLKPSEVKKENSTKPLKEKKMPGKLNLKVPQRPGNGVTIQDELASVLNQRLKQIEKKSPTRNPGMSNDIKKRIESFRH